MTKLKLRKSTSLRTSNSNARSLKPQEHRHAKKSHTIKTSCSYALESFISACGSLAEAARFLDVQRQHVQTWRYRGEMGAHTAIILNKVPKCVEAGFTSEFMRPDLSIDDWERIARYEIVEVMQAKVEHMNAYAIELKQSDDIEIAQSLITYDK